MRAVKSLSSSLELGEDLFPPPPEHFDKDVLPRKSVLHFLRVMLGDKAVVVRAEKDLAWKRISAVSRLLPSVVRETVAVINGIFLPEFADLGHPTLFLVPSDFDLTSAVRSGYVGLDEGGLQGFNLPRHNPWDRFVVGHLTAGDTRRDLRTLVNVCNRYRPLSRYTPTAIDELVKGFETARSCFDEDGSLNIKRAPSDGLKAAGPFFEAGHPDIVFDIFLGCLELLGAREMSGQVRDFGRMIAEGAETLSPLFMETTEDTAQDIFDFDV
jgi:hypothetical protein